MKAATDRIAETGGAAKLVRGFESPTHMMQLFVFVVCCCGGGAFLAGSYSITLQIGTRVAVVGVVVGAAPMMQEGGTGGQMFNTPFLEKINSCYFLENCNYRARPLCPPPNPDSVWPLNFQSY
jgi:hypothetical protein